MNQKVRVCGPKDKPKPSDKVFVINVTSQSTTWTSVFSPFTLGPVKLYDGLTAANVENAWQFSKVYKQHTDEEGNPTDAYWSWASEGWDDTYAHRYPMGRGAIPEYSFWAGQKLGYIEAREQIYVPLYREAVEESGYFDSLVNFIWDLKQDGIEVYLFDFDGYDNVKLGLTLEEVQKNPNRKMGHAFVLVQMLEEALEAWAS